MHDRFVGYPKRAKQLGGRYRGVSRVGYGRGSRHDDLLDLARVPHLQRRANAITVTIQRGLSRGRVANPATEHDDGVECWLGPPVGRVGKFDRRDGPLGEFGIANQRDDQPENRYAPAEDAIEDAFGSAITFQRCFLGVSVRYESLH